MGSGVSQAYGRLVIPTYMNKGHYQDLRLSCFDGPQIGIEIFIQVEKLKELLAEFEKYF